MGFEDDMIVIVSRGVAFSNVPRPINKLITVETIVLIHVPFSFSFFYDEMDSGEELIPGSLNLHCTK